MLAEILIKGRGNSCLIDGGDTNYLGEGLHYPIYGGKKFPALRDGYEVLKGKNSQILKEDQFIQLTFQTHCLEI